MSSIWKQELAGKYTSGDEDIENGDVIDVMSEGLSFHVTDYRTIFEYFDTMEKLAIYLDSLGLPPLYMIPRSDPSDWKVDVFEPDERTQKLWRRSTETKNIEVLRLLKWDTGLFTLYLWESGYQYPMHFETAMLDYAQYGNDRNPETDFEVAIAQAMNTGSSSASKAWYDITQSEIKPILESIGVTDGIEEF
jgi:hypothetical protein